jgi:hypothetical protein
VGIVGIAAKIGTSFKRIDQTRSSLAQWNLPLDGSDLLDTRRQARHLQFRPFLQPQHETSIEK